jgi:hypothetical protein
MSMRIHLAWQRISDGRLQIRRWSPDHPDTFMGYQRQNTMALHWLSVNGDPLWPNCHVPDAQPYETVQDDAPLYRGGIRQVQERPHAAIRNDVPPPRWAVDTGVSEHHEKEVVHAAS